MNILSKIFGWPSTLIIFTLVMSCWFFPQWPSRLEGRYMPVVEEIELVGIQTSDGMLLTGSFYKTRECRFLSIEAVLYNVLEDSVRVPVILKEGTKLRSNGVHEFGPWIVDVSPLEFRFNTVIEVTHRCHAFFDTVTKFYPDNSLYEVEKSNER